MNVENLKQGILQGDRAALSRAITLTESKLPEHIEWSRQLLSALPKSRMARRVAITGAPGVGKSTFINMLGQELIKSTGQKLAVLAVDPSSSISGGSILGDKTRMQELSALAQCYIRPSPSGSHLGGVAERTMQAILLCEAAGFDHIWIETVGVGQSETEIRHMTDFFVLLLMPGAGDALQGIKRGIMEISDLLVIHQCDGNNEELAKKSEMQYQQALEMIHPYSNFWKQRTVCHSSLSNQHCSTLLKLFDDYFVTWSLHKEHLRREQDVWWLKEYSQQIWKARLESDERYKNGMIEMETAVKGGLDPFNAARKLMESIP